MRAQPPTFLLCLLALFVPLTAFAQSAPGKISLHMSAGKPLVDGVYLNGQGPYRFLLDTGSQSNEVEAGLARKAGLTAAPDVQLRTPSGTTVHTGRASKVSLSTMEAADEEFLLTDMETLHRQNQEVRGVLGQEFLRHFDYTLDMAHHQLIPGTSLTGQKVAVRLISGRMAVPTSEGDLILDSGAELLLLFHKAVQPATSFISGAGGTSAGISMQAASLISIGNRQYHTDRVGLLPVREALEAGLLPLSLFKSVSISNSGMFIMLNPE